MGPKTWMEYDYLKTPTFYEKAYEAALKHAKEKSCMHILAPQAADVRYLPSQDPGSKKNSINFAILLDGKPICIDKRVPTNVYTMLKSTD